MFKFHNFIKKKYIDKNVIEKDTKLLDLACGRGGDIYKWKTNEFIKRVEGYDINESSIAEANKRLKYHKPLKTTIKFNTLDLTKNIIDCKTKFDLITSFFAFHYFFSDKKSLNTVLTSINNCSKPKTRLVLALFDGDLINYLPEEFSVEDSWYINKILPHKNSDFGNKIEVHLKNSILSKPEIEYVVTQSSLEKHLATINFKLVESKYFYDIKNKFKVSGEHKAFSDLNKIYVFEKY